VRPLPGKNPLQLQVESLPMQPGERQFLPTSQIVALLPVAKSSNWETAIALPITDFGPTAVTLAKSFVRQTVLAILAQ
jgi:hypothetical protein